MPLFGVAVCCGRGGGRRCVLGVADRNAGMPVDGAQRRRLARHRARFRHGQRDRAHPGGAEHGRDANRLRHVRRRDIPRESGRHRIDPHTGPASTGASTDTGTHAHAHAGADTDASTDADADADADASTDADADADADADTDTDTDTDTDADADADTDANADTDADADANVHLYRRAVTYRG